MKYMGSKSRLAKHILPILLEGVSSRCWFVDPFVGGGNIIDKVFCPRLGADINPLVISALKLIRDDINSIPKNNSEFTEEDYHKIKKDSNNKLHGYAAFALSYGGKQFGGWRRDGQNKRDYVREAYENAKIQHKNLQGTLLVCKDYSCLVIPKNSIVYCDPPYSNTTKYATKFDHERFFDWCRKLSKEGKKVFVSEYSAPSDFQCVWSKEICSSLTKHTGEKKAVEKLFIPGK